MSSNAPVRRRNHLGQPVPWGAPGGYDLWQLRRTAEVADELRRSASLIAMAEEVAQGAAHRTDGEGDAIAKADHEFIAQFTD